MAYRIVYGKRKRKGRGRVLLAAGILAFGILGRCLGWGQYLIPGDRSVTAAAAQALVEQIGAGAPVAEAFADFCREILDAGTLY